jgi:uncharacterized membrane-anchored protein YhcB (DUF1043 family)
MVGENNMMWRWIIIGIVLGIIINVITDIGKINSNVKNLQDQISGIANDQYTIQTNIQTLLSPEPMEFQCTASDDGMPGDLDCKQQ